MRGLGNINCKKCGSTRVKSVPIVYQQGLSHTEGYTRFRGVGVGLAAPDLFTGSVRVRSSSQTELSRTLRPPARFSYRRAIVRSFLFFFSLAWLLFYVRSVVGQTPGLLSVLSLWLPSTAGVAMLFMTFLVWRHNQIVFPREYARWNQAFLCEQCGTVNEAIAAE